jgi:hypothetical protein
LGEELTQQYKLPERTVFALADAALGFRIRNATYRGVAEVSDQLASRDLRQAVTAGLLVPKGERRGRYYEASDRLRALRTQTVEFKIVPDPFTKRL